MYKKGNKEDAKKAIVITGDVIGSSALAVAERKKMVQTLQFVLKSGRNRQSGWKYEIFQGDSFQGIMEEPFTNSLRYGLWIITTFLSKSLEIRIALGIGEISFETPKLSTNDGTAFRNSGRMLEVMKGENDTYIRISTGHADRDAEFTAHCISMDYLIKRCSILQAQAIALALDNHTQTEIGRMLKISQPTVQQRLQAGGWPVFKAILARFESLY